MRLAESTLQTLDEDSGAVIPQNLTDNAFIHYTADNIDILDETMDGNHIFHATQMAARQRTVELFDVNQIRIIVPTYGTKTLHDVVLNY